MAVPNFRKLVQSKIDAVGVKDSAKLFGVSAGTISNWHSGKTDPSLAAIEIAWADQDYAGYDDLKPEDKPEVKTKEFTWEGKDVIMLLPVYRSFNAYTHFTLFANYAKYGPEKLGMIIETRTLIHEARNILSDKFLKLAHKPRIAIMCDDDLVLPCGNPELFNGRYGAGVSIESASFNAISRIMSHPFDKRIVGGLYFGRVPDGKAQCCSAWSQPGESDKLRQGNYSGLKEEEWVATGFMRIDRDVFEEKKAAIDAGKFPECMPTAPDRPYGFFAPARAGVGEDVSFGRRCTELGIRSYLDTSLILLHAGDCFYGVKNTRT